VDGTQRYGVDIQLPGMVYAAVAQSPVYGGKVRSFDDSRVKARRGIIKVLSIDNGSTIAVVADSWWRAKEALKDVPVDWDFGANANVSSASMYQFFQEGLKAPEAAVLPNKKGDVEKAFAGAAKVLEAEYFTPYLCHAPMEPMGCTVQIKDGRVDVWASTQNGEATLASVAGALKVPPETVYFHKTQAGGGFGRRGGSNDYGQQAALIAKELPPGTPVKMLWSREEDTQHDFYRPLAMYKLKAGIDANGMPVGWQTRVASGSLFNQLLGLPLKNGIDNAAVEGFSEFPYEIPNQQHEFILRRTHVPIGFWRTVGWSQSPFAREQFIDELAGAAGKDPYQYRRELLKGAHSDHEKRALMILDSVAKAAGWGKPLPQGRFRGIATTEPYGSYTSAVVELSVDKSGGIKIHRVVQAIDCGYAVNPDNIVAQIEGSTVWATTAAMWGEITFKDGRAEQSNFDTYRMMRMREMPKVEVVIAPTGGFWGGVGEPGQAPLIPALCNALFAATGKRIRALPLKNQGFHLV
jgi:isoquinoline 1-oxidoreductase subunit beta